GKSVAETKELLQKNKELRAKPTKPKEYIKIDYHQQHYTTKDLEKLEAMLQDRQEVLKNINEKISYYKAKTDEIKARNADDEKKYNDLYFSTAETDEATREAIWQQMKAIKENNAAFLKQNQRIVDTYFGYQRKANKIESEIEFLQDKITKLEAQKVDSSVESHTKHQDYNTFNQSLKDAHDFFKANNKDAYNDKLFDDVIKVANALDIRFWYQPNAVYMAGSYTYRLNRIMLQSDNFSKENANTMLHELIHSVTSRAIYAYDNKALREKLSEKQIEAITELKNLYKEVSENNADKVWQKMATFKDELENNKEGKLYGLKNEHEMLAELANPSFREFLKEQNIFSKIIEAMAKIFSYVKDKLTGESIKSTNAQSELETILYKIMDNYTNRHAFTNEMSEHFGSRNFVDTTRYKEYIKDHKQKFDKDNYKGKHTFSFTEGMNFYNRSAISGKERFFQNFINNAYFDEKDFDIVQKLKWQMMDPVKRPANFMELKTEKNAHIFEEVEKTHENNIKSLVKEYYGVSYDEFNNAFNGAMKDKHFYEVKNATPQEMLRDKTSTEATFLLALKPYFTSELYKLLNEADFNVIKDSLYRILQDENLTYRNKPINEWFAKEWVEQDVKALQESFQYKLEQPQGQKGDDLTLFDRDLNINFNAPMKEIKPQLLAALKPIFNQTMTSADGKVKAYMSLKSLSKMTSDKAIQKSVDNGFSREQHLQAVLDIERLFENSKLQATEPHKSGETNAIIHRLNSELANGNALITTKESLDINKNRVYSLELELIPRFSDSSTPLNTRISEGGFNSQKGHQEQTIKAEPSIAKTDEQIVAQQSTKLQSNALKVEQSLRKAREIAEKWQRIKTIETKIESILNNTELGLSNDKLRRILYKRKVKQTPQEYKKNLPEYNELESLYKAQSELKIGLNPYSYDKELQPWTLENWNDELVEKWYSDFTKIDIPFDMRKRV
uniref:LPD3 domain-containing protein n=1 Tax=Helicobacter cinaedi TaxID=213 RepID=UPI000CF15882